MIRSTISNSSIGFLILLFTKIRNTSNGKEERGLCSFLYTMIMKMSHWKYN